MAAPIRRRGPNKKVAPAIRVARPVKPDAPEKASAEPSAPSKRRRRASVGGHATKLNAPIRPGYERRWFNDAGNRLADAQELGYEFVSESGIKTDMPGSRITRRVGTAAAGGAQLAYLMETPVELYAEGIAEREAINSQVDQAIVKGADFTGQMQSSDGTYGHGSIASSR